MDVVITVGKVRAPYTDMRLGAPQMYWSHAKCQIHAVKDVLIVMTVAHTQR
jgi:hypothetical protein